MGPFSSLSRTILATKKRQRKKWSFFFALLEMEISRKTAKVLDRVEFKTAKELAIFLPSESSRRAVLVEKETWPLFSTS